MAVNFVGASSEKFHPSSAFAVVTGTPFSVSAWVRPTGATAEEVVFGVYENSTTDNWFECYVNMTSNNAAAYTRAAAAAGQAFSINGVVAANEWSHVGFVFTSATSRAAYARGGNKGTDPTSRTPTGINDTAIGGQESSVPSASSYFDGRIAEVCVWNVALTDNEMAALGAGVRPLMIQPASIVAYYPLWNNSAAEDYSGNGNTLDTANGTPDLAAHAPVMPQFGWDVPRVFAGAAAPPAAESVPVFTQMHQRIVF